MARRSEPRPELPGFRQPVKPMQSITEHIFESLKESILSQQLPSGTPLIESHLAEEMQVSKTPVREALQKLAQTGLVDMAHTRGASVHGLSQQETKNIFELRMLLEPQALLESALFISETDLQNSKRILRQAHTAIKNKDRISLSQLNNQFHRSLYNKCPNNILLAWLDTLADRRRLLSLQGWAKKNRSSEEWQEHLQIFAALEAGKPQLAAKRLHDHIKKFSKLLLQEKE